MKSIIGLLNNEGQVTQSTQDLKDVGIPDSCIFVSSEENVIQKLLGCDPICVISRYTGWGIAIGIAIYLPFALLAGMCQCNLMQFGQVYGLGAFLGGVLAGAFVGGGLGCLAGVAEFEQNSHLYVQGARMGSRVIVVQAREEEAQTVKRILIQERAAGVKFIKPAGV